MHELTGGRRGRTLESGLEREPRTSSSSLESLSSNLSSLPPKSKSSPGEVDRLALLGGEWSTSSKSQMLEGFAVCCRWVGGAGAAVGLGARSGNPQPSSSSGITGGVLVDDGGGAGFEEVGTGVSKSQSKSSFLCWVACFEGGVKEGVGVPRESKPTQAGD